MSGCAWVTLATNDTYCLGALVLGHSLKRVSTRHQLAIIITPQVSSSMREQLLKVFNVIHLVDVLDSQDAANLALLQRPDLGVTFTKIHCWNLTQYSKCVFLDADTLVMQNCDELMERDELSAAPDPGWPDCFNSGVFVFVPSHDTFKQLLQFASTHGSFDGGDQGLLNMYFNDWPTNDIRKHLSFLYNMCSTTTYTYLPALQYYGANIKIVHFIGVNKPWLLGPSGSGLTTFTQAWWDIFKLSVVQHLSKDMSGLAGALGSKEKSAIEEQWRKQNWEQGNIDYTGKDSFENIWHKIMEAVNKSKPEEPKQNQVIPKEMAPKEIASQAIPEKEKADIPAISGKNDAVPAPLKDSTNIQTQVVPTAPSLQTQPTDPTSILVESNLDQVGDLPKIEDILKGLEQHLLLEEQKLTQLPGDILKTPISDLPILPEKPKAEDTKGQIPSSSPIQQPIASQIPKTPEAIKPDSQKNQVSLISETPKTPEAVISAVAQTQETVKPELPKSPPAPIQDINKVPEAQKSEVLKTPEAPTPKLPEVPKPETPKSSETTSVEPSKIPEAPKPELPKTPDAPLPEPPKIPEVPKAEPPKTPEPLKTPDAPKSPAPTKPEAPKTPQSSKKGSSKTPALPKLEAPKTPETSKPGSPKTPKPGSPKTPEAPKQEAPKTPDASKQEVPKTPDATKQEPPKTPDASKQEAPKAPDAPKQEAPKTPDASKQEAPKTPDATKQEPPKTPDASKQEAPKTTDAPKQEPPKIPDIPKQEAPKTAEPPMPASPKIQEAPKPETQKISEEPKLPDSSTPEAPKSPQVLSKQDIPALSEAPKTESAKPQSESQKPTPNNGSSQGASQPQTPVDTSNAPVSLSSILDPVEAKDQKQQQSQPSTGKQQSPPTNGNKKQKTPPKEGQKPQKQQAPQPPPKNGKGKKGHHPEPTTAHPLSETPALPGAGNQQVVAQEPITPPTSPESAPKLSEPQPATPTITAPTPPISPLEVSKVEDPLTAQLKTEEVKPTSTSGPAEAPVPPKRKGKGNEKQQPQKNQNGGKGKGKK